MKQLIYFFSFFLVACGSSPEQPKVNDISLNIYHVFDVIKRDANTFTFSWLSRSRTEPLYLSQFTLRNDQKIAQEIYNWADGDKYFQKINISADADLIPQYLQITAPNNQSRLNLDVRFGDKGKVVFQKIFLNNRFYQLNPDNLQYIEDKANSQVKLLKERNHKDFHVYQGYWQDETFVDCDGRQEYDLEFPDDVSIPESAFLIIRARKNVHFLPGRDSLEEVNIIWRSSLKQTCFRSPE